MPTIPLPTQLDDGSHLIPIHSIRCDGCDPCPGSTGAVRWHPERGVTFQLRLPASSDPDSYYFRQPESAGIGCGSFKAIPRHPRWTALTAEKLPVAVYPSNEFPFVADTPFDFETAIHVKGQAVYAEVTLSDTSSIAFSDATLESQRFFFLGFDSAAWDRHEPVRLRGDSAWIETHRCSIELCDSPTLALVGADPRIRLPDAAWLSCEIESGDDPFNDPRSIERHFLSLLSGRLTRYLWQDRLGNGNVNRVYFGSPRASSSELDPSYRQPLPLRAYPEPTASEVVERLSSLLSRYRELNDKFNFTWILHPLWTALQTVIDERFALASLSLERLTAEWKKLKEARCLGSTQEPASIWKGPRIEQVRDHLKPLLTACLDNLPFDLGELEDAEAKQVAELQRVLACRIESNLFQPPNSNKLAKTFTEVGLELSEKEITAIEGRNTPMHGRRTLLGTATSDFDREAERFDVLRMLITRAVLAVLAYRGPYVNYAARNASGNFPVERLEVADPLAPGAQNAGVLG